MRLRIPRIPQLRTVAEIVGAVPLLSAGAASAAVMIPAAGSPAIHACEEPGTGELSIRQGAACPSGDKAISWNKTGPAGPSGTTGIFGANTNTAPAEKGAAYACVVGKAIPLRRLQPTDADALVRAMKDKFRLSDALRRADALALVHKTRNSLPFS